MSVPETSVYEYCCFEFRQDDIGGPRQVLTVQSEPQTPIMERGPYVHFGLSVFAPDRRHNRRSFFRRKLVHVFPSRLLKFETSYELEFDVVKNC